jgi:hypothetical protein
VRDGEEERGNRFVKYLESTVSCLVSAAQVN